MSKITKINVGGVDYELGGSGSSQVIETTYAQLKELVDSSGLTPGNRYRITDFVSIFNENVKSANHPFDLIVTARSVNAFYPKAEAAKHEGDDYFVNCDLSAWEIWYDFNNDTNKYSLANSDTGKGFIYRMIDEHLNDTPYDLKNLMRGLSYDENEAIPENKGVVYFYTFSIVDSYTDYLSIEDASVKGFAINNKIGRGPKVKTNVPTCVISLKAQSSELFNGYINNNKIYDKTIVFANTILLGVNDNIVYKRFNIYGVLGACDSNTINGYVRIKNKNIALYINSNEFKGDASFENSGASLIYNIIFKIGKETSFKTSLKSVNYSIINIDEGEYNIEENVENAIISGVSGVLKNKQMNDL